MTLFDYICTAVSILFVLFCVGIVFCAVVMSGSSRPDSDDDEPWMHQ